MKNNMMISQSLILSVLLCSAYALPAKSENYVPADKDLNAAETIAELRVLFDKERRGYSDSATKVVESYPPVVNPVDCVPVVSSPEPKYPPISGPGPVTKYPPISGPAARYPTTTGSPANHPGIIYYPYPNPNYGDYEKDCYRELPVFHANGYASGFPSYGNHAVHSGHGYGKY